MLLAGPGESDFDDARAFSQHRVAMYLATLGGFLAALYLVDLIGALGDGRYAELTTLRSLLHVAVVLVLLVFWLVVRRGNRPLPLLATAEAGGTFLVVALAALVAARASGPGVHAGAGFCVALVLVVRAALVPSSARRTLALGLPVIVAMPLAYAATRAPGSLESGFVAVWMTIFVIAAALVSRFIYGLQQRLRTARKLGQYTIEGKLGEGGMGAVYRARHGMLRRPTALKLLKPGFTDDKYLVRFEREVRMTSRLSHPNTVTVYDFGRTADGLFYYAMELLDGADLDEVVTLDGPQCAERVVHVLAGVAGALAEAHDIGLIHRDIKPSNIMLCRQGGVLDTPKVLDFGLVHELGGDSALSQAGTIVGTPMYLSPEAVLDPRAVDGRSDLYALGAVGYFLLTGQHVFVGKTAIDICRQHLDVIPIAPSVRLGSAVPAEVEKIVLDCLAKSPAARPANAVELQDRLHACRGLPAWDRRRAQAWWQLHDAALRERRAGSVAPVSGLTLGIDPVRS